MTEIIRNVPRCLERFRENINKNTIKEKEMNKTNYVKAVFFFKERNSSLWSLMTCHKTQTW